MRNVNCGCPLCGYAVWVNASFAKLSDFSALRCNIQNLEPFLLLECTSCGLRYYNLHYTESEIVALYDGYRGSEYIAQRLLVDPGYANEWAWLNNHETDWAKARISEGKDLFRDLGITPQRILDYGGEDGWLTKAIFPESEIVVYDISNGCKEPEGVFDLVYAAFILEHVHDPIAFVESLKRWVAPGGLIYLEVPAHKEDMTVLCEHVTFWTQRALAKLGDKTKLTNKFSTTLSAPSWMMLAGLDGEQNVAKLSE